MYPVLMLSKSLGSTWEICWKAGYFSNPSVTEVGWVKGWPVHHVTSWV